MASDALRLIVSFTYISLVLPANSLPSQEEGRRLNSFSPRFAKKVRFPYGCTGDCILLTIRHPHFHKVQQAEAVLARRGVHRVGRSLRCGRWLHLQSSGWSPSPRPR